MSKTIGVVLKPDLPEALDVLVRLKKGVPDARLVMENAGYHAIGELPVPVERVSAEIFEASSDIVLVVGGDGTMIHASSLVQSRPVPVLGVNGGFIGFLTEVTLKEFEEVFQKALEGELQAFPRMRLEVEIEFANKESISRVILNDAVLSQRHLARLGTYRIKADGQLVTTVRGDGILVATPTGSTAYSMAAGGAIISPVVEAIAVTPINPHQLSQRQLILPSSAEIVLTLDMETDVMATLDGQWAHVFSVGDTLKLQKAKCPLMLFHVPWREYFDTLRTKLHWGKA